MAEFTSSDGTQIFYKDWGAGQPIVFSHGWPLSSDDWNAQMLFFLHHGSRVIAHDRRGHGRYAQVSEGNDMDRYADDLVLAMNGDGDQVVPDGSSGPRAVELVQNGTLETLRRLPARDADDRGRDDQRGPPGVHPVLRG